MKGVCRGPLKVLSRHVGGGIEENLSNFRLLWPCIMNVGWRERNQQDATNLMFITKPLSQHVSGIIMPIIRRTRVFTAAYGVLHCNKRATKPQNNTPDLTDTRTRYQPNATACTYTHEIPTMFITHYSTQRHYGSNILRFCSPLVTVQNTICGSALLFSWWWA